MTEVLDISLIRTDGGTQSRAGMNEAVVREYTDLMRDGIGFPDIAVFHDGTDYWLADGFHRLAAAKAGQFGPTIRAEVKQGTKRDAVLHSVGANSTHGLRRTNADKQRAVKALLEDEEWRAWSDQRIAKQCGVDHKTVGNLRKALENSGEIPQSQQRIGSDGRKISVPAERHWGLTNGMAFWQQVQKFDLPREIILHQLQPGAKVLTDLKMSKQDAWRRLGQLATERVEKLFPPESYVRHPTGRYGRVLQGHPTSIRVYDYLTDGEDSWMLSGVMLSTPEAFNVWKNAQDKAKLEANRQTEEAEQAKQINENLRKLELPPAPAPAPTVAETASVEPSRLTEPTLSERFPLDTKVLVEGSDVVGTITDIGGLYRGYEGQVCVTRPHPNTPGVNMTHWVSADKVKLAPASDDPVIDEWAGDSSGVSEPNTGQDDAAAADKYFDIDHQAPRPWQVDYNRPNNLCRLRSATGRYVASVTNALDDTEFLAYFIVAAVNEHHEYKNMAVHEMLPNIRRILDFVEGRFEGPSDGLLGDIMKVQEILLRIRKILVNQEMDAAANEKYEQKQPEPEVVVP